jgi:hypothetical protein
VKTRTAFILGAAALGLYILRKEALATSAMLDRVTTPPSTGPVNGLAALTPAASASSATPPTPAQLQAQLVAGAQAVQNISETPITIPPPPAGITSWRAL